MPRPWRMPRAMCEQGVNPVRFPLRLCGRGCHAQCRCEPGVNPAPPQALRWRMPCAMWRALASPTPPSSEWMWGTSCWRGAGRAAGRTPYIGAGTSRRPGGQDERGRAPWRDRIRDHVGFWHRDHVGAGSGTSRDPPAPSAPPPGCGGDGPCPGRNVGTGDTCDRRT